MLGFWKFNAWKQILDQGLEEWKVTGQELWDVGVAHGSDEHDVFLKLRKGSLEITRHHEHRLHSTQPEVIVVLLRKLL